MAGWPLIRGWLCNTSFLQNGYLKKKNIKSPNPKDNWLLSVQNLAEK